MKIVEKLIKDGVVSFDESEVVEFGLINLRNNAISLICTSIIGCLFGYIWQSILVWLFIFPLRKNAGGYHANNPIKCYVISVSLLLIAFIGIFSFNWNRGFYMIVSLMCSTFIYAVVPVGTKNKELDTLERKVYKRRSRIVIFIETVILIIAFWCGWINIYKVITTAYFIVSVLLLWGNIRMLGSKRKD